MTHDEHHHDHDHTDILAKHGHHDDQEDIFNKENPHQVDEAVHELSRNFTHQSHDEIKTILLDCANNPEFHHNRERIMNAVKNKLKNSLR